MLRFDIINHLIKKYNYTSYLEIGYRNDDNFKHINCIKKESVDIANVAGVTYHMSSDIFFQTNINKYDIIFIDGDHSKNQVYKDILNALNALNENGTIVCHDMCPPHSGAMGEEGCGTAWNAWVSLREQRDDLHMFVVETDCGCGVIRVGSQNKITVDRFENSWDFLAKNKIWLLNLISEQDFLNFIKSQ